MKKKKEGNDRVATINKNSKGKDIIEDSVTRRKFGSHSMIRHHKYKFAHFNLKRRTDNQFKLQQKWQKAGLFSFYFFNL